MSILIWWSIRGDLRRAVVGPVLPNVSWHMREEFTKLTEGRGARRLEGLMRDDAPMVAAFEPGA